VADFGFRLFWIRLKRTQLVQVLRIPTWTCCPGRKVAGKDEHGQGADSLKRHLHAVGNQPSGW
jgi:hypothetical protein